MRVGLITLGLLSQLVSALAVARGPTLNWVRLPGAESCIAAVELAQLVETRLGRPVFVQPSDAIVLIEGRVEPAVPLGFAAVIRVSDPDGTLYGSRDLTLPDADCRKLDEVLALIIAVTVRRGGSGSGIALPEAIARELDRLFETDSAELDPGRLPAAQPMAASTVTPPPPAAAPPEPEPGPSSPAARFELGLTAGVFAAVGAQPGLSFGPQVGVRFGLAGVGSLALLGRLGITSEQAIEDGGTLAYRPLQAALAICAAPFRAGSSELVLCGVAAVGSMRVAAQGFKADNQTVHEAWVEAAPQLLGRLPLAGPIFLELALGAPLRIAVPDFRYTDSAGRSQSAYSMSRVGLTLELLAGARF